MEIRNPLQKNKKAKVRFGSSEKPAASLSQLPAAATPAHSSSHTLFHTRSQAPSLMTGKPAAMPGQELAQASFSPIANSSSSLAFGLGLGAPMEVALEAEKRSLADRVGIWLSFLCVIHCLATPVLLLIFPALEAMKVTQLHEGFHLALLLVLPIVAVVAFIPGYRKHQNREVFYWAIPGLLIIAYVALWFDEASWLATAVSVTGSLFLIRAHSVNRRLCACCHPPRVKARLS